MQWLESHEPARGAPGIRLALIQERDVDSVVAAPRAFGDAVVRIMRGKRCRNTDRLLQEWAAALQFPYYFGHNWDAFEECLGDLGWLPGLGFVLLVTQSHLLLGDQGQDLNVFGSIVHAITRDRWGDGRPLRVVFQSDPDHETGAREQLERAGIVFR